MAGWEDVDYSDFWCLGVCIGVVLCIVYGSFALCGCSTVALGFGLAFQYYTINYRGLFCDFLCGFFCGFPWSVVFAEPVSC